MPDQQQFIEDMTASISSKQWTEAAVRLNEEWSTSTKEEMNGAIVALNVRLKQSSLPELEIDQGNRRTVDVRINNSWFADSPLRVHVNSPHPLKDEKLERLSQHFSAIKGFAQFTTDYGIYISRADVKRAGEFLLEQTSKLSTEDRYAVLKSASDRSYTVGHSLNAVFTDLDGDGVAHDLSDLAVSYRTSNYQGASSVERIDLYDPPVARKK